MTKVLVLSVGGSPQPLRTAIEHGAWDRVVFVVSDGSGESASSKTQVEAAEIDYDRAGGLRGPGLRHLPACPKDFSILPVPPDDLDRALALIDTALAAEVARGARITVDYTGGTKTMTAAMVLAGTAQEGARMQFMAGARQGLEGVSAGSERPFEMPTYLLGMANLFALARAFVARRSYRAALDALDEVDQQLQRTQGPALPKPPGSWRKRTETWRGWLTVLDAWDRFDFQTAARRLTDALEVGRLWAKALEREGLAARLDVLLKEQGMAGPALCEDLWLNAERRAALGLYDDAIARLYRLAEAAVQARLRLRHDIPNTGSVSRALVPDRIASGCATRRDGKSGEEVVALPLYRALDLLAHLDPEDALAKAWPRQAGSFPAPDWQSNRNRSILAHGFRPAAQQDWQAARDWFGDRLRILWEEDLGRPTAPQLPSTLP